MTPSENKVSFTNSKEVLSELMLFRQLWSHEGAQDIAEYAVMLAVILVIVVGTLRLVGSNLGPRK